MVVSGSIVMKVQMATMLKGRVMNGRENMLRRLLRALVMKTLQQTSDKITICCLVLPSHRTYYYRHHDLYIRVPGVRYQERVQSWDH